MAQPKSRSAASHIVPHLSIWERVALIGFIGRALRSMLVSVIIGLVHTRDISRRNIRRYMLRGTTAVLPSMTLRQQQYLLPTTGATVATFCKAKGLAHNLRIVDAGERFPPTTLHFVGCTPDHRDMLLFFHGGGFTVAASPDHVPYAYQAAQAAGTGLCFLEYGLTPENVYPTQLAHCIAALRSLLETRDPSQVIIGGDSAGGNLTLGTLAHLIAPQPDIAALDLKGAKLKGAMALSPRTSFNSESASYSYNADKDILTVPAMEMFSSRLQSRPEHVWCTPLKGDYNFWNRAPVERLIMVVGGDEVFLEEVKEFASVIQAEEGTAASKQLVVCPHEMHCQCVFDAGMGLTDGMMYNASLSWLKAL